MDGLAGDPRPGRIAPVALTRDARTGMVARLARQVAGACGEDESGQDAAAVQAVAVAFAAGQGAGLTDVDSLVALAGSHVHAPTSRRWLQLVHALAPRGDRTEGDLVEDVTEGWADADPPPDAL